LRNKGSSSTESSVILNFGEAGVKDRMPWKESNDADENELVRGAPREPINGIADA
jgi:hypothetical protein